MLRKMSSILVVGPRGEAEQIVDTLYQQGTVHLVDLTPEGPSGPGALQRIDEASLIEVDQLLLKVNGLLKLLPKPRTAAEEPGAIDDSFRSLPLQEMLEVIRGRLEGLDATTVEKSDRKAELELAATTQ